MVTGLVGAYECASFDITQELSFHCADLYHCVQQINHGNDKLLSYHIPRMF